MLDSGTETMMEKPILSDVFPSATTNQVESR